MVRAHRRATNGARRPAATETTRILDLLHALGSTVFRQLLWQKSSELDLTYAQSRVLFYVHDHAGCHMGDVAKAYGVTLPAVTHVVDRLEKKGFVVRGADPADRRVWVLEPTREGQALVAELATLQRESAARVLARMTAADRKRLLRGLEALVAAADVPAVDRS